MPSGSFGDFASDTFEKTVLDFFKSGTVLHFRYSAQVIKVLQRLLPAFRGCLQSGHKLQPVPRQGS